MTDDGAKLISDIYDAALEPDRWQSVVDAVARNLGTVGCCYLVTDKLTGNCRQINVAGPMGEVKSDYVDHFAPIDPYAAILGAAEASQWTRLGESLSEDTLRGDEWYNDFLLKSGVVDVSGVKLFEDGRWLAMFGVHESPRWTAVARENLDRFQPVLHALGKAAKLHHDLDRMGWQSTVALHALEQMAAGVVVADASGRLLECNAAAERILGRDDGIQVRHGLISTRRVFETSKLIKMIAAAAKRQGETSAGHMLVVRSGGAPYAVTVTPLSPGLSSYERPLAMVLIADPDEHKPPQQVLSDLYGFSRAEGLLAVALMRGQKLSDVARDRGVSISTIRTQLSSILKKVGAERQADLVRIFATTQMADIDPGPDGLG